MKALLPLFAVLSLTGLADGLDAKTAFAQMKTLAGEWHGTVVKPDGPKTFFLSRTTPSKSAGTP